MKIVDIKKKSNKELFILLNEKKEKLRELRFDLASGKIKNVKEIRNTRKDVAKIMTIINNQEKNNIQETNKI